MAKKMTKAAAIEAAEARVAKRQAQGLYTIAEAVAEALFPYSERTLWGLVNDGKIKAIRMGGARTRVFLRKVDVEAYLASCFDRSRGVNFGQLLRLESNGKGYWCVAPARRGARGSARYARRRFTLGKGTAEWAEGILAKLNAAVEVEADPDLAALMDRARLVLSGAQRPKPIPEGPRDGNLVRVGGRDHVLPPLVWRALRVVWDAEAVPLDRFEAEVWGVGGAGPEQGAVKMALSRANAALADPLGVPWALSIRGGNVVISRPAEAVTKK